MDGKSAHNTDVSAPNPDIQLSVLRPEHCFVLPAPSVSCQEQV